MPGKMVLYVEGPDDKQVLKNLCDTRSVIRPHDDDIEICNGIDALLESLPVRLKASQDGDRVGIIVDADLDAGSRWQQIRERLVRLAYTDVPADPAQEGTIIEPPRGTLLPRVGIWIMPNNKEEGVLEDFLRLLIPPDSGLFRHVQSSVATIPPEERRFDGRKKPKALIYTWLAWQKEPGKRPGTAITARYLDANAREAESLLSWLERLFGE